MEESLACIVKILSELDDLDVNMVVANFMKSTWDNGFGSEVKIWNLIDDAVNVQQEGRRNILIGSGPRDPPRAATAPYSPSSNVWACSRGVAATRSLQLGMKLLDGMANFRRPSEWLAVLPSLTTRFLAAHNRLTGHAHKKNGFPGAQKMVFEGVLQTAWSGCLIDDKALASGGRRAGPRVLPSHSSARFLALTIASQVDLRAYGPQL
ncbi:unnamed protein product [Symbiodinium sp. KB8]|nr:unnamed protein product [Symbiodinium sp. KB8]